MDYLKVKTGFGLMIIDSTPTPPNGRYGNYVGEAITGAAITGTVYLIPATDMRYRQKSCGN